MLFYVILWMTIAATQYTGVDMKRSLFRVNKPLARSIWGKLSPIATQALDEMTSRFCFSVASGDLLLLDGRWYVTHSALLHLATRKHCNAISASPLRHFCDAAVNRWAFKATVYKSRTSRGFVAYGEPHQ